MLKDEYFLKKNLLFDKNNNFQNIFLSKKLFIIYYIEFTL